MAFPNPIKPLIAAYANLNGTLFAMSVDRSQSQNALKYLGRATADGSSNDTDEDWHETSLQFLNANSPDTGDYSVVSGNPATNNSAGGELLQSPWYAIFEHGSDAGAGGAGDLWVGRFFQTDDAGGVAGLDPAPAEGKVFVFERNQATEVADGLPHLIALDARRAVLIETYGDAGAPGTFGAEHGGSGSLRNEW
ncbi:hypothetical protein [Pseudoruegeria sp. HB172150]|uniref:hypothetical protein n=1 Tax=Pseudoruegeria sp. HB172150 TaxID=2721164 RepID=UPI001553FFDC|nr:hypothetical protein [Pseudoruegeria sp. HB172150]